MLTFQLTKSDLDRVVDALPQHVKSLLVNENVFLAGGSILSILNDAEVSDYDFFGTSKEDLERIYTQVHNSTNCRLITTKNAATVILPKEKPVQFITRWVYQTAEECMLSFDFAVCRVAIWYDKEIGQYKSVVDSNFYNDFYLKRLTYTAPIRDEDSVGSLLRAFKYCKKGYNIPKETIMGVVARFISGLDTEDEAMYLDEMDEQEVYSAFMSRLNRQTQLRTGDY